MSVDVPVHVHAHVLRAEHDVRPGSLQHPPNLHRAHIRKSHHQCPRSNVRTLAPQTRLGHDVLPLRQVQNANLDVMALLTITMNSSRCARHGYL